MAALPHEIYVANADLIERVIRSVCRRHNLYGVDAEDFAGVVRIHLIENDYAVLRRFEGRSSLPSYLTVVITRQFQDWRNARWGKWRPSAEARRLGDTAVRLETLTVRDGLSLDEAHEVLRTHNHISDSRAELESLAARFPQRHKRSFVGEEAVDAMAATTGSAEDGVMANESATAAQRASVVLTMVLRQLPPRDRLILKMRFEDNCPIADIAKALQLEAKPLYRHIEKLLGGLRRAVEAGGLTAADAALAWSAHGFDGLGGAETWGEVRPFDRSDRAPALTGGHRE